jgi:hypothetical protein
MRGRREYTFQKMRGRRAATYHINQPPVHISMKEALVTVAVVGVLIFGGYVGLLCAAFVLYTCL